MLIPATSLWPNEINAIFVRLHPERMDRIRRFQRSLITILAGINSFVFSVSNDFGVGLSLFYAAAAMLATLTVILAYILIKKRSQARRVSGK